MKLNNGNFRRLSSLIWERLIFNMWMFQNLSSTIYGVVLLCQKAIAKIIKDNLVEIYNIIE